MRGEYAIVGPAIFVLETMPELALICRYAKDRSICEPREVWIDLHQTWMRLDGNWISGWRDGEYFGFRPNFLNRWKIRRAARSWARQLPSSNREAS